MELAEFQSAPPQLLLEEKQRWCSDRHSKSINQSPADSGGSPDLSFRTGMKLARVVLMEKFIQKRKFSHYPLTHMLMEGRVSSRCLQSISGASRPNWVAESFLSN